jgi:hypothetical protein
MDREETMSLPESLERAASELSDLADQIRPANGDPQRLLEELRAAEAGQLLAWILNEEPESANELIQAWGEIDGGADILLALPDEGIAKAGRKLLRKARHRLRSKGIEAATPEPPRTTTRRVGGSADRWQAAHVSTPDFRGERVAYLVDSHPAGGARLFEVRFDESRGILDFKIYNAGRSKIRGFLRSLTAGTGRRLFEVDRDPLRALVRRASLAQPIDRPLPTAFVEWRSRLFSEDLEKQPTPGDLVRAALGGNAKAKDSADGIEATMAEIREGQLGPWPPKTEWVGAWMTKARESTESLEGEARAKAIDSWLEQVSGALAKETDPVLLARHLDEAAWVRWQSDSEVGARALLELSESLPKGDEVMSRFSRARVEGLFSRFLTELRVVEQPALDSVDAGEKD